MYIEGIRDKKKTRRWLECRGGHERQEEMEKNDPLWRLLMGTAERRRSRRKRGKKKLIKERLSLSTIYYVNRFIHSL